jgi:cell division GTPase FtsZ
VASPLLDGIDLSGAKGVLVNVTASRGLKGKEIKEVMAAVRAFAAPDAAIAQGIAYDDEMGDELRVTVVATGLGKNKASISLVQPQQVLRTGTYNTPGDGRFHRAERRHGHGRDHHRRRRRRHEAAGRVAPRAGIGAGARDAEQRRRDLRHPGLPAQASRLIQ